MPELGFYLAEVDVEHLVKFVFSRGAFLIPDLEYNEPTYTKVEDIPAFRTFRILPSGTLFFVGSYEYWESPLELRQVSKSGLHKYYILQRNGGPTIDLYIPKPYENAGVMIIASGSVSYYPTYWSPKSQKMLRPPESLRRLYKDMCRLLKQDGEVVTSKRRAFVVGCNARSNLEQGARLGGVFSSEPPHQI